MEEDGGVMWPSQNQVAWPSLRNGNALEEEIGSGLATPARKPEESAIAWPSMAPEQNADLGVAWPSQKENM